MAFFLTFAAAAFAAGLSKSTVNATIHKYMPESRACYEAGLKKDPKLSGKVTVKFSVAKDGKVKRAAVVNSEIPDEKVGACITEKMKNWKFPESLEGEETEVAAYPFLFRPAK